MLDCGVPFATVVCVQITSSKDILKIVRKPYVETVMKQAIIDNCMNLLLSSSFIEVNYNIVICIDFIEAYEVRLL